LNFDLNYTPFHLTHGPAETADARIELLPVGLPAEDPASWIVLPDRGVRGGERYRRYQRLGSALAFFGGPPQNDHESAAWLARGVATHMWKQEGFEPLQIRCRRHTPQSLEAVEGSPDQRDPWHVSHFQEDYRANTVVIRNEIQVIRVEEASQVAPPDTH
jgi:hypothetical protein